MNTEYKEGNHDEFIHYLFTNDPKPKGSIQLESPLLEPGKNEGLHIFEQLLMIFVDGLKFFFKNEEGKINLSELTEENILKVKEYFVSMNYDVIVEVFPTMNEYQFKFPDYFKNQEHIKSETELKDFYYEVFNEENCAFRISFTFLN